MTIIPGREEFFEDIGCAFSISSSKTTLFGKFLQPARQFTEGVGADIILWATRKVASRQRRWTFASCPKCSNLRPN